MYAAKKYILPFLEEECREILIEGLAPTNIWEVYTSSIMTPDEELHAACREYYWASVTDIESILKSPHFLNIPYKVLLDMLQLNDTDDRTRPGEDRIIVSQIKLFKACNAWAEAECLRQELKPSGENKRDVLGACLFLVSFMTMLPEDLVRIVFPTEILNKDEKCALLEAAHSGYAWLTHPMCVPSELKFIVRWHQHTIGVKYDQEARPIQEYSPIKGCLVEYSSIILKPNRSLMLLGILCLTNNHKDETKREVIIKAVDEGVRWSKSVIVYASKRDYEYLLFHEQHLEAGCEYVLEVENRQQSQQLYMPHWSSLSLRMLQCIS